MATSGVDQTRYNSNIAQTPVQLVCKMWRNRIYHASVASCNVAAMRAADNEHTRAEVPKLL
jgi:hypothetical protein